MTGTTGRPDPLRELAPGHEDAAHGVDTTKILQDLRDADITPTVFMRELPPPKPVSRPRQWFRGDDHTTPWNAPRSRAPESRVERTGRIHLPADHDLAAVRQEARMRLRDATAGAVMTSGAEKVLQHAAAEQMGHWFGLLKGQCFQAAEDTAKERDDATAESAAYLDGLFAEYDAWGLEKAYPRSVTRHLGRAIARHETTPWRAEDALRALD